MRMMLSYSGVVSWRLIAFFVGAGARAALVLIWPCVWAGAGAGGGCLYYGGGGVLTGRRYCTGVISGAALAAPTHTHTHITAPGQDVLFVVFSAGWSVTHFRDKRTSKQTPRSLPSAENFNSSLPALLVNSSKTFPLTIFDY